MSKSSSKTLAKTKTLSVATTINATEDTVITLPKSQLTISVKKGMSTKEIKLLDQYFSKHKNIPTQPNTITPNVQDCTTYEEEGWVYQNQYQPTSGKKLGIWGDWLTPSQAYTLGFREKIITNSSQRNSALQAGFTTNNLMLQMVSQSTYQSQLSDVNSSGYTINRTYIDEPYESNTVVWSAGDLSTYISYLEANYPSANLTVSSWLSPNSFYEQLVSVPLVYIMDDYYKGDVTSSWNTFKNGYGSKNVADWISLEYNQDGTGYSDYSSCFGKANQLGLNDIWLYAHDYNSLSLLQQYSYSAWANGWLLRLSKQLIIIWKCSSPSPCTNCSYPSEGDWYVYDSYYTGQEQWVAY